MAKRTAKQKAATKRLIAFNKAKRKTPKKSRKSTSLKRSKPRKSMAKRQKVKSFVRRRTDLKGIFKRGALGEAVKGVGAGSITALVTNQFMPQYTPITSTVAGFLGGGIIGGISSLLVNGGIGQLLSFANIGRSNAVVNGGGMGV